MQKIKNYFTIVIFLFFLFITSCTPTPQSTEITRAEQILENFNDSFESSLVIDELSQEQIHDLNKKSSRLSNYIEALQEIKSNDCDSCIEMLKSVYSIEEIYVGAGVETDSEIIDRAQRTIDLVNAEIKVNYSLFTKDERSILDLDVESLENYIKRGSLKRIKALLGSFVPVEVNEIPGAGEAYHSCKQFVYED